MAYSVQFLAEEGNPPSINPASTKWIRQDQLLLHSIIASVTELIIPLISSLTTSKDTWAKLERLFANHFRSRIMTLKERLTLTTKGNQSVAAYIGTLKSIADELAIVGARIDDVDLVIHSLNGVGPKFKELFAAIRAQEFPIIFEEFHDKFTEYENFLKCQEVNNDVSIVSVNHTRIGPPQSSHRGSSTSHSQ